MDLGLGLLNTLKPNDAINWLEDALNKYKLYESIIATKIKVITF